MPVLEILKYPDKRLRLRSENVEINDQIRSFVSDLTETMVHDRGAGLAAIQVGQPYRIFVIQDGGPRVFINPVIKAAAEHKKMPEGCLSFPGVWAYVDRPTVISVEAFDLQGNLFHYEQTGVLAQAVSHENDHLDGVTFIDHLSSFKRRLVLEKYNKR